MFAKDSFKLAIARICTFLVATGPIPYYALGLAALFGFHAPWFAGLAYLTLGVSHQLAYRQEGRCGEDR